MSSIVEDIKSRLNIVDIAQEYLKLEKAGGNFKACCPFHNERSPSFFISPSRQTFHCFGCNEGGDIISFVERIEGLDFQGALKVLADRAGVVLTKERKEDRSERESVYATLELATKFYQAVFPRFPEAMNYLTGRGLTPETIEQFRVGFAPDEWRALGDFLKKKGVSDQTMERAGLIVRTEKGYYDRFRGRVMFPITDSSGRVIAFSGRILKEEAGKTLGASASAKYVNSPETEVFHKSKALFGISQAKDAMRRGDACVLVEGQMDLILSHQSGVRNAVASSGTALTGEHLEIIKRFTHNVILAFDADDAGLSASLRAVGLALSQDMNVRIARLPRGMDPADLARENPAQWVEAIQNARPVIDFYLEFLPAEQSDRAILRRKVTEIVVPLIAMLKNSIEQGHYVSETAKLLGIKDEPVWDEVRKCAKKEGESVREGKQSSALVPVASRRVRILRVIQGVLLWQERSTERVLEDTSLYRARLQKILEGSPPPSEKMPQGDELILEAEIRFQGSKNVKEEIEELMRNLTEEILRERFALKMNELKQAEMGGNRELAEKLLAECQLISKELHALTNIKQ